jgi:hypothetical protein
MADFWDSFEAVSRDFTARGIRTVEPGFYDDPNFVAAEKSNPAYLFNYARFVYCQGYTADYLACVRREVPVIANAFVLEVQRAGRLGACVDASMILSRMLEREGIWNYCVKGSLHIVPPASSGVGSQSFWAFAGNGIPTGHAWIYAPPFEVIDTTVRLQPYGNGITAFIPDFIVSEGAQRIAASEKELISPELHALLTARGLRQGAMLSVVDSNVQCFGNTFRSHSVRRQQTEFRYVVSGVTAGDAPLERTTNLRFGNRSALEVYEDVVRPALHKFRQA